MGQTKYKLNNFIWEIIIFILDGKMQAGIVVGDCCRNSGCFTVIPTFQLLSQQNPILSRCLGQNFHKAGEGDLTLSYRI
jgi:hypothetical protein